MATIEIADDELSVHMHGLDRLWTLKKHGNSWMPLTTLDGHQIHVNDEGFLTDPAEWSEDLAATLAAQIGIELTDAHLKVIRFLREDYQRQGETATIRPGLDRRGHPREATLRAVPAETGQEDGLHRRPAQATRLRLNATHDRRKS